MSHPVTEVKTSDSDDASNKDTYIKETTNVEEGYIKDTTIIEEGFVSSLHDNSISEEDLAVINAHLDDKTLEESLEIIRKALRDHSHDPCAPLAHLQELRDLLAEETEEPRRDWEATVKFEAFIIDQWSIYPEVRAVTKPIEEVGENYENFRVYVLGIFWSCAGSSLATFFANRFPSISLGSTAIQILIVSTGTLWGKLPKISIPLWKGKRFHINKGPWTFKEQMLATLTMSASAGSPYALSTLVSQQNKYYYNMDQLGFGYMIMLVLSSELMGFSIAGIMRSFLVYPVTCVWYAVLPTIALNRALLQPDSRDSVNGWKLFRIELFWIVSLIMFAWYWVTNFLFTGLAYFDWMAWIKPDNIPLQAVTGVMSGMGLNIISTFDVNVINPVSMVTPFFSTMNAFAGIVLSTIPVILIWVTNTSWAGHLPVNLNSLYTRTGEIFNVREVVDDKLILDEQKYLNYSMPFYTAGNLVSYGAFFAVYPAMVVFSTLNYPRHLIESLKSLWIAIRHPRRGSLHFYDDRFSRAQKKLKEVPEWWFFLLFLFTVALSIALVQVYTFSQTPVWTIFFAIGLGTLFTPLFGRLYATTNIGLSVNVLAQLIVGYALEGNGNALMICKVYATNLVSQADNFVTSHKVIHYTGISPRSLFRCQVISVTINCFAQVGILYWQLNGGVDDICNIQHPQRWRCVNARTYANAAILWGTIGPRRVFSNLYPALPYCFLIGALFPIPFWLIRRYGPRAVTKVAKKKERDEIEAIRTGQSVATTAEKVTFWRKLAIKTVRLFDDTNEMVFLTGCISWGSPGGYWGKFENLFYGWFFNSFLKNRFSAWWKKYNYIVYCGCMVGIGYSGLIHFFATQYTRPVEINWWGNNVMYDTLDAKMEARYVPIPEKGYFGPETWDY